MRPSRAYGKGHTDWPLLPAFKTYRLTNLKLPGVPGLLLRADGADAEEVLVAGEVDFDGHGFGRNALSSCFAEGQ